MIYPLCDIAGRNRATGKPIVSTCVMDMQVQLLHYFAIMVWMTIRIGASPSMSFSSRNEKTVVSSEQRLSYAQ